MNCKIENCKNQAWKQIPRKQLCHTHYRHERAGVLGKFVPKKPGGGNPGFRREFVEYRAAHSRIAIERGKAKEYFCTCGDQATEWALLPNAEVTHVSQEAGHEGLLFSLNVYDYMALCTDCHHAMDGIYPPVRGLPRYHSGEVAV